MTKKRKRTVAASVVAMYTVMMVVLFGWPSIANAVGGGDGDDPTPPDNAVEIVHYNDYAQVDAVDGNEHYFSGEIDGDNPWEASVEAYNNGEVDNIVEYHFNFDGTGEYQVRANPDSGRYDNVALAGWCIDTENRKGTTILDHQKGDLIGRKGDNAADEFEADPDYAREAYSKLAKIQAEENIKKVYVEDIGEYTSGMYQLPGANNGNPSLIVRNTVNTGGHALVIEYKDGTVQRFRIECGYQPIDVEYWPTPDAPPVDDTPPGDESPENPDPDPWLEPKDPDAGPQGQNPDNPDIGGGPNQDNDTTVTEDPKPQKTNPDVYIPPAPPKDDDKPQTTESSKPSSPEPSKPESSKPEPVVVKPDTSSKPDLSHEVDTHPAKPESGANPSDGSGNSECDAPE